MSDTPKTTLDLLRDLSAAGCSVMEKPDGSYTITPPREPVAKPPAPHISPLLVTQGLIEIFRDRAGLDDTQERLLLLQEARAWIELAADLAVKDIILP